MSDAGGSDLGGPDRRGIEIPADVARAAGVPEDLNANEVGEYTLPDTRRRRTAGLVYLGAAVVCAGAGWAGIGVGMWVLAGVLVAIAAYHRLAGVGLVIREGRALDLANASAGFPVGHASASLGFVGLMARPVWNVLVFSADEPPTQRGLVRVSALDGEVVEQYVEAIQPEG